MDNKNINDAINKKIKANGLESCDWQLWYWSWLVYWCYDLFNIALFKDQPVPVPVISFERTNIRILGHYVPGRNAIGVRNNININSKHLKLPFFVTLSTLLHELVHSWEYIYVDKNKRTTGWYHSKAFREKLSSFGIECNEKGHHISVSDPLIFLLEKHAFIPRRYEKMPDNTDTADGQSRIIITPLKPKGKSTLKKWICECDPPVSVRVGRSGFAARCMRCNGLFRPAYLLFLRRGIDSFVLRHNILLIPLKTTSTGAVNPNKRLHVLAYSDNWQKRGCFFSTDSKNDADFLKIRPQ